MADERAKKNSEEVKKNTQDAAKASKELAKNMGDYSQEADSVVGNLATLADRMRKTASASRDFGAEMKEATNLTKQVATQAKAVTKFTEEGLKDRKTTEKFLKKELIVRGQIQAIESKIANLQERAVNATAAEQKLLNQQVEDLTSASYEADQLLKSFDGIRKQNELLNSKTAFFDSLAEVAGDIPVVGKFFKEFGTSAQSIRDAGGTFSSQLVGGISAATKLLGKFTLLMVISEFVKAVGRSQKQVKELTSNLNMTQMQAEEVRQKFADIAEEEVGKTAQDLVDAVGYLSSEMGIVADTTNKDLLLGLSTAVHKLGLASGEAVQLAKFSQASGDNFKDFQNNVAGTVELLNVTNGTAIRFQSIMKDISETGAATLLTTDRFPGGIEKAAYQARRFGLSMAMLESSSQNLLEFESSIASELEAELLTGRSLNLERARAAALMGNQSVLAEEIRKNVGDIDQFTNQSVLAQEAQAKALGMTRDQVAQMLMDEKAIAEMGGDRSKSLSVNVKERLKEIKAMDDANDREKARQELIESVGGTQIEQQIRNQTFQERQLEIMTDMFDQMEKVNKSLIQMTDFFGKIGQNVGGVAEFLTKVILRTNTLVATFGNLGSIVGKILKFAGQLGKAFGIKSIAKGAGKMAGKVLLKKIPIIGALYGTYLAYKRMKEGDWIGGLMEFGSGLASIFPGLGTAASLAMDASLVAMDAKGITGSDSYSTNSAAGKWTKETFGPEESDFISRPGGGVTSFNKGDLILGGTNLMGGGNGINQMLERQNQLLEQILNKSSDVKMNTYSVQSALVVDNFKNG